MKKAFWNSHWFFGLCFCLLFAALIYLLLPRQFGGLERAAYDVGVQTVDATPSDRVAVIAIDDKSIANLGRWPWPRNLHAELIARLHEAEAKVIGHTVLFVEPQLDPGLAVLNELDQLIHASSLSDDLAMELELLGVLTQDNLSKASEHGNTTSTEAAAQLLEFYQNSSVATKLQPDLAELKQRITEARQALNTDQQLALAMAQANNVVLSQLFTLGQPLGNPDQALPASIQDNKLSQLQDQVQALDNGLLPVPTLAIAPPIELLADVSHGIGHLNANLDLDGAQRSETLVVEHYGDHYPSMALLLAAKSLNLSVDDIIIKLGQGVQLGGLDIHTNSDLSMYAHFYKDVNGQPAFPVDSIFDVLIGDVPTSKYKDKIVIIGATANGIGDRFATPISAAMAPAETQAHIISSILQQDFFVRPDWAKWLELGLVLLMTLYLSFALPKLSAGIAAIISLTLVIALAASEFILLTSAGLWFQFVSLIVFLSVGHIAITIKLFRITERLSASHASDGAESNRMLGLAFQNQGQLDMAFEKFRKCPVDDSLLEALQALGGDYESKRQFTKAVAVYEYMAKQEPKFPGLQDKLERAKNMADSIVLGVSNGHPGGTLIMADGQKPMLGRYQVEKELGRGAMGVVYLGTDPKINRTVAIKTLALAAEFEADELDDVKARFFREAETAGRLSHPNIVTIFDAGEEHDLAYIAMEFLFGQDMVRFTKADALLSKELVIQVIAQAADALHYAHQQNVVHRDIKPANLVYNDNTEELKITDFGIARITDASKTKTGMVLGTPSFMSPEQLAGDKVDGRSDLFSLGVTLYQLLTGELPFASESVATLMFKITNDEHRPLAELRQDLPAPLEDIICRALAKDKDKRWQNGLEMATALRDCLREQ